MKTKEFQKILVEKGQYQTDKASACTMFDRLFGWIDLWYYINLLKIIYLSHKLCSKDEWSRDNWAVKSHDVMKKIEGCGGIINISGTKNLSKLNEGPAVYISNHMSMIETFVLPVIVLTYNKFLTTVLKKSLMKYPVFRTVLKGFDAIIVSRENPREDLQVVLKRGEEMLSRGRAVLIFPQSTRSVNVNKEDFNTLGVKLAKRAGVPVVPLALKTDFLRPGKLRILRDFGRLDRKKKIYFSFGEPLQVEGNGKETHSQVVDYIDNALKGWKNDS